MMRSRPQSLARPPTAQERTDSVANPLKRWLRWRSPWPARGHVKLNSRLRLVVAGAITVLVLLLFVLFAGLELRGAQERQHERASAITAVLAENVRGSLAFFDIEAASKILSSAGTLPGIRWAALLNEDRRLFASFAVPQQPLPKPAELIGWLQRAGPGNRVSLFEQGGALYVIQAVQVDGEPIGWLMLNLDAENPSLQFLGRLGVVMLAAAVFGLIASFAAARALERIAWPIMNLASMMREVSITHDYRMRLMYHRSDEIGELHDGFNGLLEQLEAREQEIAAHQSDLVRLANLDEVTQLSNRHHFRQLLDRALKRAADVPFALLCLDLDRFKNVNDSLGHDMGDQVLRLVGERLRSIARSEDTMARTGGDEFSVIMGRVSHDEEALPFARRILASLREPFEINGLTLHIGASIGIALAPRDATRAEQLIKYADLALYEVKAAGRNTVRMYQPSMGSQVDRRLVLEQELREALARGQLTLVYQPQIETRDRTVIGLEALLRWNHPELGTVTPAEFIPIAEDSGLIVEIGAWVLEEACREVQLHDDKLSIAVNLSPVQVMTQDLGALIDSVLSRTGLAAHRLELEITESVLLNEENATLQQMAALQTARRAYRARRLRHRLCLDGLSAALSLRKNQDRPQLRASAARAGPKTGDRARDHRDVAADGHARAGRRRGKRVRTADADQRRLHRSAGLLLRAAARRAGPRVVPAHLGQVDHDGRQQPARLAAHGARLAAAAGIPRMSYRRRCRRDRCSGRAAGGHGGAGRSMGRRAARRPLGQAASAARVRDRIRRPCGGRVRTPRGRLRVEAGAAGAAGAARQDGGQTAAGAAFARGARGRPPPVEQLRALLDAAPKPVSAEPLSVIQASVGNRIRRVSDRGSGGVRCRRQVLARAHPEWRIPDPHATQRTGAATRAARVLAGAPGHAGARECDRLGAAR